MRSIIVKFCDRRWSRDERHHDDRHIQPSRYATEQSDFGPPYEGDLEYIQNRRRNHCREHYSCQTTSPWRCHPGSTQDLPPSAFWLASNGASWWWRVCRNLTTGRSKYLSQQSLIRHANFLYSVLRLGLMCVSLPRIDLPNTSTILITLFLSVGCLKDNGYQNLLTTISLRPSRSVLDFTAALGGH